VQPPGSRRFLGISKEKRQKSFRCRGRKKERMGNRARNVTKEKKKEGSNSGWAPTKGRVKEPKRELGNAAVSA